MPSWSYIHTPRRLTLPISTCCCFCLRLRALSSLSVFFFFWLAKLLLCFRCFFSTPLLFPHFSLLCHAHEKLLPLPYLRSPSLTPVVVGFGGCSPLAFLLLDWGVLGSSGIRVVWLGFVENCGRSLRWTAGRPTSCRRRRRRRASSTSTGTSPWTRRREGTSTRRSAPWCPRRRPTRRALSTGSRRSRTTVAGRRSARPPSSTCPWWGSSTTTPRRRRWAAAEAEAGACQSSRTWCPWATSTSSSPTLASPSAPRGSPASTPAAAAEEEATAAPARRNSASLTPARPAHRRRWSSGTPGTSRRCLIRRPAAPRFRPRGLPTAMHGSGRPPGRAKARTAPCPPPPPRYAPNSARHGRAAPFLDRKISSLERSAGGFQRQALQIDGGEQCGRRGEFRQGEGRAEQQREWRRQEAREGQLVEAPRAAQGLHPCPRPARRGDGQPQPRREGTHTKFLQL